MDNDNVKGEATGTLLLFAVVVGSQWLGTTWYETVALLLASLIVFAAAHMMWRNQDTVRLLTPIARFDRSVPYAQRLQVEAVAARMRDLFFPVGAWLRSPTGLVHAIYQNPNTFDVLTITAFKIGWGVEFRRRRSDGTWLGTCTSSTAFSWPTDPRNDVLRLLGEFDTRQVWDAHCVRVARDPLAAVNPPVTDPLPYQNAEDLAETTHVMNRGFIRPVDANHTRPTLRGTAYSLWVQLQIVRPIAKWRSQRILKQLRGSLQSA